MNWRTRPVAGIGIVGIDHVAVTERWERDAKTTTLHYFEQVGGPVPVALCAMARLGMEEPPRLYSVVGDDAGAETILRTLAEDGVDASAMHICQRDATGHSLVVLDLADGSRTLTNLPGPSFDSALPVPFRESLSGDLGLLHLDGRSQEICLAAALPVREHGGIVSYDLGTLRCDRAFFRQCDIVLASKKGGAQAWPEDADDPVVQTRRFLDAGATVAGVTLGARGCIIASRDENGGEPLFLPAFAVTRVVDTCGAGDLFHGAFLWAYRDGRSAIESARFAQAAVALRIQHYGNRAGQPTRAAVEAFLSAPTP